MSESGQRKRVARIAEVVRAQWLTPSMRRLVFTGPDLVCLRDLPYTDHYVKILFAPTGCSYRWPFDPDALRAGEPAERWPVTRTYTVRGYDQASNEMTIDFVVHGDEGLAGPWAARAVPGDQIGFYGPGGGYAPDQQADCHLLVGDEAALPAIAAALEGLGGHARGAGSIGGEGRGGEQGPPGGAWGPRSCGGLHRGRGQRGRAGPQQQPARGGHLGAPAAASVRRGAGGRRPRRRGARR